jgi:hypothetical protein
MSAATQGTRHHAEEMKRESNMKRLVSIASLALAAGGVLWLGELHAQSAASTDTSAAQQAEVADEDAPVQQDELVEKPGMYTGVVSCANTGCHGAPAPISNSNVLQNEYDTWLHGPPRSHVRAWEILLNKESRLIAKNMGLKQPADKAKICLDCHATNVPKELQGGTIEIADGVQCESCHGPAGGWRARHVQAGWTHQDSVNAGMIDQRDLRARTKNCLSCHMGDATKTVDHELIAAGHPILTFELDNFTQSRLMPLHWKPLKDKPNADAYGPSTHGVNAWAVGQAVIFSEGLAHLSRQAKSDKWPEFASMSCAACHHDLRTGEWRQERGYQGRAGLPPWSPVRWSVLRHVVAEVAPDQQASLDAEVNELAKLVASMRRPEAVSEKADSIAKKLSAVTDKVESTQWTEKRVRSLMSRIANDADYFYRNDRQSAEQATWALVSLSASLARTNPKLVRGGVQKSVDDLYKQLNKMPMPDEYENSRFRETLVQLQNQLK